MSTPVSIAALIIAVLVAYAAGQTDRNALFLAPTRVDADKAFDLEVLSFRWNCGAVYDHIGSQRGGGSRLDIAFLVTENPQAVCPAIEKAYGPKVPVKALPAGRYDVHATLLLPCQVLPQPCDAPLRQERVGILTVGRQEAADWFASPAAAAAGRPFELRILSDRYGNCQTRFEHKSLAVRDGRIVASFVTQTDTGVVCVTDVRPHGPAFQVEALGAGRYPVDVIEIPACVYGTPVCPWLPPEMAARTVDTLVVGSASAALPAPERPTLSHPRLRRRPGGLGVVWQGAEGSGLGREAERMVAPDGRRVGP